MNASNQMVACIVTWRDERDGVQDIYAQRLDAFDGTPYWTQGGIPVSTANGQQFGPNILPDGAGGAVISFIDAGTLRANRLDSNGALQWNVFTGVIIGTTVETTDSNHKVGMVLSGASDIILAWGGTPSGRSGWHPMAQKINKTTGAAAWSAGGVALASTNNVYKVWPVSDGSGGAVVVWGWNDNDIYGSRILSGGTVAAGYPAFTTMGVAIATFSGEQHLGKYAYNNKGIQPPYVDTDGSGGAIVAWMDNRSATTEPWDIYAQRLGSDGLLKWGANGLQVTANQANQGCAKVISDTRGGAYVFWFDDRDDTINGIYGSFYGRRIYVLLGNAPWAPELLLPVGATPNVSPPLTWSSSPSDGSPTYAVTLDDGPFLSPEFSQAGISGTTTTVTATLVTNVTYYWRVQATNSFGTGPYSAIKEFTVDTTAPTTPTLLTPANFSTTTDTTPLFDWSDATDN